MARSRGEVGEKAYVRDPNGGGLVRRLTLTHAVLYGVGVTIGAGIYVLVGVAAGRSGMYAPLGFLAAAVAMGLTAASFAELATRMPVSASEAAYVDAAFHRRWLTTAMGLLVIAGGIIGAATISAGSVSYIGVFVNVPPAWIIVGVVVVMGFIAGLATTQSIAFAGLMTLIEVAGLLLLIGAGFFEHGAFVARLPEMLSDFGSPSAWQAVGATTVIAVFAFIGFEHIVNIAEEMREPSRTLPRALFVTLAITTILYMLVVWISVAAVPPAELAGSNAPLALVFQRLTGVPLIWMSVIAIVATLNGVVVHMIMVARVLYGMSKQGNLPRPLSHVNSVTRTPHVATAVTVAAILLLTLGFSLEGLAELASLSTLVIFVGINMALIRIKTRERSRPAGVFNCPLPVAYAGLISSILVFAFGSLT